MHGNMLSLLGRLRGGKGGFGALLRGQGRDGKITTNYDACRDLSGRRLRHINADKKLEEWSRQAKERELEQVALKHLKEKAKEDQAAKKREVKAGERGKPFSLVPQTNVYPHNSSKLHMGPAT